MKYTYDRKMQAHYVIETVIVPDQVAADQKRYDLAHAAFPVLRRSGRPLRVRLDGKAYGLHTTGTGDMIVREA